MIAHRCHLCAVLVEGERFLHPGGQVQSRHICAFTPVVYPWTHVCVCKVYICSFMSSFSSACFSTAGQDSEVPCYSCHQTRKRREVPEPDDSSSSVVANNSAILIRVPVRKAHAHSRLLKLATGFTKSIGVFNYEIIDSSELDLFFIDRKKEGRAVLRFSKRVSEPGVFSLEIEGKILETDEVAEEEDNTIVTEPLALFVEVEVYE